MVENTIAGVFGYQERVYDSGYHKYPYWIAKCKSELDGQDINGLVNPRSRSQEVVSSIPSGLSAWTKCKQIVPLVGRPCYHTDFTSSTKWWSQEHCSNQ